MAGLKRLQREYQDLLKNKLIPVSLNQDNWLSWQVELIGANVLADTIYRDGIYKVALVFSESYPFKPPKVKFITPIDHFNVDSQGHICLSLLADKWQATVSIDQLIQALISLIKQPDLS